MGKSFKNEIMEGGIKKVKIDASEADENCRIQGRLGWLQMVPCAEYSQQWRWLPFGRF